ncbi:uncharacterized protein AMSG_04782, partial [Thecamonas trahens ATCC 50062]
MAVRSRARAGPLRPLADVVAAARGSGELADGVLADLGTHLGRLGPEDGLAGVVLPLAAAAVRQVSARAALGYLIREEGPALAAAAAQVGAIGEPADTLMVVVALMKLAPTLKRASRPANESGNSPWASVAVPVGVAVLRCAADEPGPTRLTLAAADMVAMGRMLQAEADAALETLLRTHARWA